MRISTIGYYIRQGFKNIRRNLLFSLASVGTIVACLFIFGFFYAVIVNFRSTMQKIEGNISAEINNPFKDLTTEELRKLAED